MKEIDLSNGIVMPNFSNYVVFPEEGKVFNLNTKKWIGYLNKSTGYWYVTLYDDNGEKKNFRLSRLIWESVNDKIPEGLQVNHIDEDKSNNSISNLNLMTPSENTNFGTRNARAAEKLSKQVAAYKDGVLVMMFPSTAEAQRQGYHSGHVSESCRGKLPHYKGYQWQYFDDCPLLFYMAS